MSKIKMILTKEKENKIMIHTIKNQYLLTNEQYVFILKNLGKTLTLLEILYYNTGELHCITIKDEENCLTLFANNEIDASVFLTQCPSFVPTDFQKSL